MNLSKRKEYILNIVQKNPGLGKTALMKIMFMLQEVKGVKTGYDFSVYTYGPYATSLMEDIDELIAGGLITCTMYPYRTYIGYSLQTTDEGKKKIPKFNENEKTAINDIVQFAKDKSAKELELYSTIIYMDRLFNKNSWDKDPETIASKVHEIKPHFSVEEILNAHHCLNTIGFI